MAKRPSATAAPDPRLTNDSRIDYAGSFHPITGGRIERHGSDKENDFAFEFPAVGVDPAAPWTAIAFEPVEGEDWSLARVILRDVLSERVAIEHHAAFDRQFVAKLGPRLFHFTSDDVLDWHGRHVAECCETALRSAHSSRRDCQREQIASDNTATQ